MSLRLGEQVVDLRPATAADEPFLRALYATTRPDVAAMVGWSEVARTTFLDGQFRAQLAGYRERFPASQHLIITLGQEPAGRLWTDRSAHELRVVDISLLPAHRGAGIGTLLLRRLIGEAASARLPVRLSVSRDNPRAVQLYRRLGFTVSGEDELRLAMELRPAP